MNPNSVKNSEGGEDPDNNSPMTGDRMNNIKAGGIFGVFNKKDRDVCLKRLCSGSKFYDSRVLCSWKLAWTSPSS